MLPTKLISCEWGKVGYWNAMRASGEYDNCEENEYTEADIDNFVEITFREFAERIKVRYRDIKDILYGRNVKFFEEKAVIFSEYESIDARSNEFKSLTSKLMMPNIYGLVKYDSVQAFLDSFSELNVDEKVEVLDRLLKAKIEVLQSHTGKSGEVLRSINSLSLEEQCAIIKSVFLTKVNINVEMK